MRRLSTHIGKDRVLRVVSQQTRSQAENRELAIERFVELLRDAAKTYLDKKEEHDSQGSETSPP